MLNGLFKNLYIELLDKWQDINAVEFRDKLKKKTIINNY